MLFRSLEHLCLPASASTSSTSASASVSDTAASACSLDRWHRRLGHPSRARLHTLSSSGSLGRVSSSSFSPCIGCQLAKHHALPFSLSESISAASFDLVHTDIWGPAPLPSRGGFSYYVCFVDDFSRYTWLYLMRSRSDVLSIYRQFTEMVHTQFGKRIKVLRSDGAREYLSTAFRDLLSSHGLLRGRASSAILISASVPRHF